MALVSGVFSYQHYGCLRGHGSGYPSGPWSHCLDVRVEGVFLLCPVIWISGNYHHCGGMWWVKRSRVHEPATQLPGSPCVQVPRCCSPESIDQLQLLPGAIIWQEGAGFCSAGTASALYPPVSTVWGPHPDLAGEKALFVGLHLHCLAVK